MSRLIGFLAAVAAVACDSRGERRRGFDPRRVATEAVGRQDRAAQKGGGRSEEVRGTGAAQGRQALTQAPA